jgi:DNA-directed RNA polymerase subunit N (RpoN/RPB10)
VNATCGSALEKLAEVVSSSQVAEMIIPMRCFECGKLIADKWRGYQKELKRLKGENAEQRVYFDGSKIPVTPEKKVLDALNLNTCCRTHFLTQVDLIDKI